MFQVFLFQYRFTTIIKMAVVKGKLISVIGDEDTVVGFLLGGIGELNKQRQSNFFVVGKNTAVSEIEEAFKSFCKRDDIGIILISQNIAEMIRYIVDSYHQTIPTVSWIMFIR